MIIQPVFNIVGTANVIFIMKGGMQYIDLRTHIYKRIALIEGYSLLSGRQDSNLRPPGPKPGALPGCATSREIEAVKVRIKDRHTTKMIKEFS